MKWAEMPRAQRKVYPHRSVEMRIVIQRVTRAAVEVAGATVGEVGPGLMVLVGFGKEDTEAVLSKAADKLLNLRIFSDEAGRFMHSVKETAGGVLLVSQFTLFADTSKGRRPEFFGALEPGKAKELFEKFIAVVQAAHAGPVASGVFGAMMQVSLVNDGPVTIMLELMGD
jgi:D-tyrosyl-tRNA(Tyr) deacylase